MSETGFISKSDAISIISILNGAYKAGVIDAEDVDDECMYDGFADEVSVSGVYGRINRFERLDVQQWRISLLDMNRDNGKNAINILLCSVIGKKYIDCLYPLTMEFYLMGIKDYNENPTIHDFSLFNNRKLEKWTKNGIKSVSKNEMLIDLQVACLNRSIHDANCKNKYSFPRKKYETFIQKIWYAFNSNDFSEVFIEET